METFFLRNENEIFILVKYFLLGIFTLFLLSVLKDIICILLNNNHLKNVEEKLDLIIKLNHLEEEPSQKEIQPVSFLSEEEERLLQLPFMSKDVPIKSFMEEEKKIPKEVEEEVIETKEQLKDDFNNVWTEIPNDKEKESETIKDRVFGNINEVPYQEKPKEELSLEERKAKIENEEKRQIKNIEKFAEEIFKEIEEIEIKRQEFQNNNYAKEKESEETYQEKQINIEKKEIPKIQIFPNEEEQEEKIGIHSIFNLEEKEKPKEDTKEIQERPQTNSTSYKEDYEEYYKREKERLENIAKQTTFSFYDFYSIYYYRRYGGYQDNNHKIEIPEQRGYISIEWIGVKMGNLKDDHTKYAVCKGVRKTKEKIKLVKKDLKTDKILLEHEFDIYETSKKHVHKKFIVYHSASDGERRIRFLEKKKEGYKNVEIDEKGNPYVLTINKNSFGSIYVIRNHKDYEKYAEKIDEISNIEKLLSKNPNIKEILPFI